jgi:pilus assembly protein FimV
LAVNKPKILAAAQKHLSKGNVDRALRELARIVKDDPKDLRVRQKIAELLGRQGKVTEAMREFQIVAEAYERGGFYPKAAAIYKQSLRYDPDNMTWHLALGEIYQQLALLSDAMDHFDRVAKHFEDNGTTKERIQIYTRLLKLNPDNISYAERLSELWRKEQDYQEAYDVFARLAPVLEQRGDTESMVKIFERMADIRPEDLVLARDLATLYLDRGDPKRALAKLQICFKEDPQDTETLNLLADAFVDLGEREKAVAVLKELAQIYEALGYEEYRNQVFDRIAEVDPIEGANLEGGGGLEIVGSDDPVGDIALSTPSALDEATERPLIESDVYLAYGMAERALAHLQKSIATTPDHFELHRAIVPLYVHNEDLDAANAALNAMYEIAMDRSDYAAAKACLSRSVELSPDSDTATARLDAFVDAMGDFLPEESEPVESSELDVDIEDFGGAIELGQRLATTQSDDEADSSIVEDSAFDFDDDEMQALAAQLEQEMEPRVADAPLELSVDLAGPVAEAAFSFDVDDVDSVDEDGTNTIADEGMDLGDFDFDDLGDIDDTLGRMTTFELAESYYKTGMFDDAAAEFRRAVSEGERVGEALQMLGVTLRRLRDFQGAVDAFRDALTGGHATGDMMMSVMFELGVTYEAGGSSRSAYKVYKKLVGRQKDYRDGEVVNRLSSLALELGLDT